MSWFTNLFKGIEGFFTSPKAQAVEKEIQSLLPAGLAIVQEINTLAPTLGLTELNAIATKYALPAINALESGQTAGNVALNLATQILQKNHAPTSATSTLNTVVQLAVVAAKAGEKPTMFTNI